MAEDQERTLKFRMRCEQLDCNGNAVVRETETSVPWRNYDAESILGSVAVNGDLSGVSRPTSDEYFEPFYSAYFSPGRRDFREEACVIDVVSEEVSGMRFVAYDRTRKRRMFWEKA